MTFGSHHCVEHNIDYAPGLVCPKCVKPCQSCDSLRRENERLREENERGFLDASLVDAPRIVQERNRAETERDSLREQLKAANDGIRAVHGLCDEWWNHDQTGDVTDEAVNELIRKIRGLLPRQTEDTTVKCACGNQGVCTTPWDCK